MFHSLLQMDCLEDPVSLVLQDRLENLAKTGTKAKLELQVPIYLQSIKSFCH